LKAWQKVGVHVCREILTVPDNLKRYVSFGSAN
jgi:hypothetical protein